MTSLVQAEMINSSGVYVVGRLNHKQGSTSEKEERLSLDHVVRLTVPPKKSGADNAKDVVYSLDEIKDLQSKLMLIAGKAEKGKDEVDTFVKVRKMSHWIHQTTSISFIHSGAGFMLFKKNPPVL